MKTQAFLMVGILTLAGCDSKKKAAKWQPDDTVQKNLQEVLLNMERPAEPKPWPGPALQKAGKTENPPLLQAPVKDYPVMVTQPPVTLEPCDFIRVEQVVVLTPELTNIERPTVQTSLEAQLAEEHLAELTEMREEEEEAREEQARQSKAQHEELMSQQRRIERQQSEAMRRQIEDMEDLEREIEEQTREIERLRNQHPRRNYFRW